MLKESLHVVKFAYVARAQQPPRVGLRAWPGLSRREKVPGLIREASKH